MSVTIRPYLKHGKAGLEADIIVRATDGALLFRRRRKVPAKHTHDRREARRWAEQVESDLRRLGLAKRTGACPTVFEFFPRYLSEYCRANRQKPSSLYATEHIFKKHLGPLVGHLRLDEVSDGYFQVLKANLADRAAKTVNNVQTALARMLRIALRWRVIDRLPFTLQLLKVDPPTMQFYEPIDYEGLIEGAAKHDARTLVVVLLGGDAGLRDGEIRELQASDIDWRRNQITIRRQVWKDIVQPTKGHRPRHVPMSARLAAALAKVRHIGNPHVLVDKSGKPVTRRMLLGWMGAAQRLANLEPTQLIHILRHTFGARLATNGVPPRTIQELMGHAHITTSMRYMHLAAGAKEDAIRKLERVCGDKRGDEVGVS